MPKQHSALIIHVHLGSTAQNEGVCSRVGPLFCTAAAVCLRYESPKVINAAGLFLLLPPVMRLSSLLGQFLLEA